MIDLATTSVVLPTPRANAHPLGWPKFAPQGRVPDGADVTNDNGLRVPVDEKRGAVIDVYV